MPSSLIIVALVVAWLLVLVPIVARRRQEVARTADSALAARVVRSGGVRSTAEEGTTMADAGEAVTADHDADDYDELDSELDETRFDDELDDDNDDDASVRNDYAEADYAEYDEGQYAEADYPEHDEQAEYAEQSERDEVSPRPYRPGRGGFDPEAAAVTARARYTFRQRIVVLMLMAALISGLVAGLMSPVVWWVHAAIDIGLIGYLGYLRRQVRIEEEVRERRTARLGSQRRAHAPAHPTTDTDDEATETARQDSRPPARRPLTRHVHPGTVIVDTDDEDPVFAELDEPGALPYRRAVGE